ncbi:MAG: ParB/RepB/Spo0J family partition protein [Rhodospirillales bacterium]|nr:ParB/RepB/Spo0J family partition protein [Rhodospirillales bacterium]
MAKLKPRGNRDMFGSALQSGGASDAVFGLSPHFPQVLELDVERIHPNPYQPLRHFDEQGIADLAESIQRHGLLQPVTVQRTAGGYQLVAGERRWRAARWLGWNTIFALVSNGDPAELALIENLQRQDLNAIEEAEAFARLMQSHGYTQEALGRVVGRHQSAISHALALTALPEAVKTEYAKAPDRVPKSVLMEVAALDSAEEQEALWRQVRGGGMTVKAVREVRQARKNKPAAAPAQVIATLCKACDRLAAERLDRKALEDLRRLRDRLDTVIAAAETASNPGGT